MSLGLATLTIALFLTSAIVAFAPSLSPLRQELMKAGLSSSCIFLPTAVLGFIAY